MVLLKFLTYFVNFRWLTSVLKNILMLYHYKFQILVEIFSKSNNSFTYVVPSTCFLKRNIERLSASDSTRI